MLFLIILFTVVHFLYSFGFILKDFSKEYLVGPSSIFLSFGSMAVSYFFLFNLVFKGINNKLANWILPIFFVFVIWFAFMMMTHTAKTSASQIKDGRVSQCTIKVKVFGAPFHSIGPAAVIGTTSAYHLLFLLSSKTVIVIPNANIIAVEYN